MNRDEYYLCKSVEENAVDLIATHARLFDRSHRFSAQPLFYQPSWWLNLGLLDYLVGVFGFPHLVNASV